MISIIILIVVFVLIAVRRIGRYRFQIWHIMLLGAASNVIIIQNAEKKGNETLTFWEFVKVGVPLTAVNVGVYWLYFLLVR